MAVGCAGDDGDQPPPVESADDTGLPDPPSDDDGDGLTNDEEAELGTDPDNPDTDGDLLGDGAEVDEHATDPLDRDSDDGGSTDGAEVLVDGTDPNDPNDDVCTFVVEDRINLGYVPPGPNFDPFWIGIEFALLVDANGVNDYWVDEDEDGTVGNDESRSSELVIWFYEPERTPICSVRFEADWQTSSPEGESGFRTEVGGSLLESWTIDVRDGISDCPALDASVYGTSDIRDLFLGFDWGVAIGSLGSLETPLRASVDADPDQDWATDVEPFAYGGWISWDGATAQVLDVAFVYPATCDLVDDASKVPTADAVGDGLRQAEAVELLEFDALTGITCDRPGLSIGAPGWTPGPGTVPGRPELYFELDFVPLPDGTVADYAWDSDGNGAPEPFSATLRVGVLDDQQTTFCTMEFDADRAVPIDASTLVPATGSVERAWRLELDEAVSDCPSLDADVVGSASLLELLMAQDFVFGIGPMDDLAAQGPTVWGPDWSTVEPLLVSQYLGFDGLNVNEYSYGTFFDLDDCLVEDSEDPALPRDEVTEGVVGLQSTVAIGRTITL